MVGPSVFPEKQVISEWLVLQYFQKSRLYQNGWSFSISRYTSYPALVSNLTAVECATGECAAVSADTLQVSANVSNV